MGLRLSGPRAFARCCRCASARGSREWECVPTSTHPTHPAWAASEGVACSAAEEHAEQQCQPAAPNCASSGRREASLSRITVGIRRSSTLHAQGRHTPGCLGRVLAQSSRRSPLFRFCVVRGCFGGKYNIYPVLPLVQESRGLALLALLLHADCWVTSSRLQGAGARQSVTPLRTSTPDT